MDREEWQIHLNLAEKCVTEMLALIEKQHTVIQDLGRGGHDTSRANDFLNTLLVSQARYERQRDRLQQDELEFQSKEAAEPAPAA